MPNPDPRLHNRLKDTGDKLDVPPLKPELRSFVDWVAELHAVGTRGMVLRMTLRMGEHLGPERVQNGGAAGRYTASAHDERAPPPD